VKQLLLICAVVALVGCGGKKDEAPDPEATRVPPIEEAVRNAAKKPTGELIKEDYEKVRRLVIKWGKLTEVPKDLEKLTQLEGLYLSDNQLTNVKGLENLTQLKELDLRKNQLTDLKGLENLTQLKALYLYFNPALTQAQIDELQKVLPKCGIYSNPTR